MVLSIPDSGLQLESSAKAAAALPLQAFALTLSDSVIEDMINCVQNGQDIQLSLGGSPVSQNPTSSSLLNATMLLFRDYNTLNKLAPPAINCYCSTIANIYCLLLWRQMPNFKPPQYSSRIFFTYKPIFIDIALRIEHPPPLSQPRYLCVRPLLYRPLRILPQSRAATESHDVDF